MLHICIWSEVRAFHLRWQKNCQLWSWQNLERGVSKTRNDSWNLNGFLQVSIEKMMTNFDGEEKASGITTLFAARRKGLTFHSNPTSSVSSGRSGNANTPNPPKKAMHLRGFCVNVQHLLQQDAILELPRRLPMRRGREHQNQGTQWL